MGRCVSNLTDVFHCARDVAGAAFSQGDKLVVKTASTMLSLGTSAPDFSLINVDSTEVSLSDFEGKSALVVMFICNHCPFVKHLADEFAVFGREVQAMGAAVVAISSNDVASHPADSPEQMVHESENRGYTFPYLYDEDQSVAKAYQAACTPDFFVFDRDLKLAYRGQFDDSRPGNEIPVTGSDLRAAVEAVIAGTPLSDNQTPSIGCNIKWIEGNAPEYFDPQGTA
jgi:peroxiredoxin